MPDCLGQHQRFCALALDRALTSGAAFLDTPACLADDCSSQARLPRLVRAFDRDPRAVQFQAVHWMLRRERDLGVQPHPAVRDLTAAVGAPLFLCTATGAAEVTAPADTAHCRGGFFCDEPVRLCGQMRPGNSGSTAFA